MERSGTRWPVRVPPAIALIYVTFVLVAFAVALRSGVADWPLKHDQVGYYAYLPALLTEGGLSFEDQRGPRWDRFRTGGFAGFQDMEATGRRLNSYSPGVALLVAPFFALAHLVALVTPAAADGFSAPYRLLLALSGALYSALGLGVLFVTLRAWFTREVAATTVLALGLGTNLLYYATVEPAMSHGYSFFAFSVVLWATLTWARSPRLTTAITGGLALGLVVAIRPTNGLLAIVPLGFLAFGGGRDAHDAAERTGEGRGATEGADATEGAEAAAGAGRRGGDVVGVARLHLLAALGASLVTAAPLFAYWRFATGEWVANPYGAGTFMFSRPAVLDLLFSYRKGWFVYTPIMLCAFPGLIALRRHIRGLALPLAIYLVAAVYVTSSWWNWWYGGSFGMRAMIEACAVLAPAVAAAVAWGTTSSRRRRATFGAIGLLVALNLFQTYQYVRGYIHWDGMTRATYWSVFLRPSIPAAELDVIRSQLDADWPRRPGSAP